MTEHRKGGFPKIMKKNRNIQKSRDLRTSLSGIQHRLKAILEFQWQTEQSLRSRASRIVLLVVPDICNPFYSQIAKTAQRLLRENGYVIMDDNGLLSLTDAGREIAERMLERHELLTEWLTRLGVHPDTAQADACRIEHVISSETFDQIKAHIARHDAPSQD